MTVPTEEDIYRIVTALGTGDVLESRRIAEGVRKLIDRKTVDDVLREDLERVS